LLIADTNEIFINRKSKVQGRKKGKGLQNWSVKSESLRPKGYIISKPKKCKTSSHSGLSLTFKVTVDMIDDALNLLDMDMGDDDSDDASVQEKSP